MPIDKKISELPIASSINASDISILIDNGTDYQYTFTSLLQFLAANIATGANISFGTILPQNTTGNNGDVFVNTSAGSFAQKLSGTWTVVYTLPSANAADGTLLYGAGIPGSGTGKDTDSYINTLTGIFYKKTSGTWSQVFSMATGPQGSQGAAGTNGTNGTNGNTILFGNINPSNSATGVDGDFYINTANYQFFGPKASGVWAAGVSIVGADGAAGATGAQGSVGATGAQGPTGAAGSAGAAGPGVTTGGAAGQVLAKVDGTDYHTQWVTPGGGGSEGYADRTFNQAIVFDAPFKSVYTQTGDITLSLSGTPVADVIGRITIVGDGAHALSFPTGWFNANGQTFDNTARNIIYFEYDGVEVLYSVVKVPTPDVTAPYLVSAVINNSAKNQIVLSYSELLDQTSVPATTAFGANLGKAMTAIVLSGSTITLTVDSNYAFGDVATFSYIPGGNPVQDPSHNTAITLTNSPITNNVLPATTSIVIAGAPQVPYTSVVPSVLSFGSGDTGGTDTPFSVSFWVKPISGNAGLVSIGSLASPIGTNQNMVIQGGGGNVVYFQIFNHESAQVYINSNNNLTSSIWQHVLCTYDGSKLATGMKIYFNGSLQAVTIGGATYAGQSAFVADTVMSVLADAYLANTGTPQQGNYGTKMDQLYWWNKELTGVDAASVYNGGALVDPTTLFIAGNLVARYEFDGDMIDSINGYNLISTATPTYSSDHI